MNQATPYTPPLTVPSRAPATATTHTTAMVRDLSDAPRRHAEGPQRCSVADIAMHGCGSETRGQLEDWTLGGG